MFTFYVHSAIPLVQPVDRESQILHKDTSDCFKVAIDSCSEFKQFAPVFRFDSRNDKCMQSLDCSISTPYSRPEGLQKGAQWSATVAKGRLIALSLSECYCLRRRHSAPVAIPSYILPVHCTGIKVVVMSVTVTSDCAINSREYADSSQTISRTCNKIADGSSLGTRVRGSRKDCYLRNSLLHDQCVN